MPSIPTGVVRQAAAQAQPNIALVKYWGKRDVALNLPVVGSLSITLDSIWTRTLVCFEPALAQDTFILNGVANAAAGARASTSLDVLRARAGITTRARIETRNNFPTGAGLASSASGFAALVTAAAAALGLELDARERSVLARRGSGSAARSIFGGYAEWHRGTRDDGTDSCAEPLLAASAWPLRVVVAVTSEAQKSVSSTDGMLRTARTSPYERAWESTQEADLAEARAAIHAHDFAKLAAVSEASCLKMHALAMAARPGLLYWNAATMAGLHCVRQLRAEGVPVFFTVDAGPQLKAVCLPEAAEKVAAALCELPGVLRIVECGLGAGARVIPMETVAA
ncbi:MAG: diphosphomevalonate decarboxylase [Nevskiaceae bacterium]|nr:MAG: diphosphomevalonate decarboxylase [Nevskiaceae bacterium]TBR71823.1 MAG: diphosphomevalonate decarboxylase [Nevskiaceae bacterium]